MTGIMLLDKSRLTQNKDIGVPVTFPNVRAQNTPRSTLFATDSF